MAALIPILILISGAGLAALGTRWRMRHTPVIQAVSALLAMVVLANAGQALPQATVVLDWRPISLFGMPIALRIDRYAWTLGIALLLPVLAAALHGLAHAEKPSLYPALVLATSATLLAALCAANVLSLALAWGLLDIIYCIAHLVHAGQAGSQRLELVIGINGITTLLLWLAFVFLEQDSYSPYWHLMSLSPLVQLLLGLAAILRVGLYPLYAWSPPASQDSPAQAVLIHLLPMLAGLGLWTRLAVIQALPAGPAWTWVALGSALLAGGLAWAQPQGRQSIPYLAIGYAGLLVMAGTSTHVTAAHLVQGMLYWLLSVYVLAKSPSLARHPASPSWLGWLWNTPVLVGLLSLLGLPLTAGWAYRAAWHASLPGVSGVWWMLAVVAESLLAGAAVRCALAAQPAPVSGRRAGLVIASLAVGVGGLLGFGLWPSPAEALQSAQAMNVQGWAGWGLPVLGVIALLVAHGLKLQPGQRWQRWARLADELLSLGWLYTITLNSLRRGARLVGHIGTLVEGKAALVWTLLIIVLSLLYLQQPWR